MRNWSFADTNSRSRRYPTQTASIFKCNEGTGRVKQCQRKVRTRLLYCMMDFLLWSTVEWTSRNLTTTSVKDPFRLNYVSVSYTELIVSTDFLKLRSTIYCDRQVPWNHRIEGCRLDVQYKWEWEVCRESCSFEWFMSFGRLSVRF